MEEQKVLRINRNDNVAVALRDLPQDDVICTEEKAICVKENIPRGHKIALTDIAEGADVIKYGNRIGIATENIFTGSLVHVHNVRTGLGDMNQYRYEPTLQKIDERAEQNKAEAFFEGYQRADGRVGIRNEIWIIPTVGCVNDVVSAIERRARKETGSDAIMAFRHPYGCSQLGEDQEHTRQILADLVGHPNAGGALLVGLGCENSAVAEIRKHMGNFDPDSVRFLVAQDCEDEIAEGVRLVCELYAHASGLHREKISASKLIIGLKCGGSDGLSGITANPTVGNVSDLLIQAGGSAILTEVPEMFGAEQLLMNRCINRKVYNQTVSLINDFKKYFISNNQPIYENPSPGNKEGGISTLEDKSLGCTQKSGTAPVMDVLGYGERVRTTGLSLLEAPGNDLVASTALAAAGAQLILFTTGRGTPFASPVPTIKIASNSELAEKKHGWIDFDAGTLVREGTVDILGEKLFEKILETASGKRTCSEQSDFHDLAIFKQGVTL